MVNKVHLTPQKLTSSWPDVESSGSADEVARGFVVNLIAAMDGRSIRSVAADAGLEGGSVRRILAGTALPHLRVMILLEESLGLPLCSK